MMEELGLSFHTGTVQGFGRAPASGVEVLSDPIGGSRAGRLGVHAVANHIELRQVMRQPKYDLLQYEWRLCR